MNNYVYKIKCDDCEKIFIEMKGMDMDSRIYYHKNNTNEHTKTNTTLSMHLIENINAAGQGMKLCKWKSRRLVYTGER